MSDNIYIYYDDDDGDLIVIDPILEDDSYLVCLIPDDDGYVMGLALVAGLDIYQHIMVDEV